jgi:hypothetical protein
MSNLDYLDFFNDVPPAELTNTVPVGKYIVQIAEADMKQGKNEPWRDYLNMDTKIFSTIDGDASLADRHLFPKAFLPTDDEVTQAQGGDEEMATKVKGFIGRMKRDLKAMGIDTYDPTFSLSDFCSNRLSELLDIYIVISVTADKRDPNNQNINIQKRIEWDDATNEWVDVPLWEADSPRDTPAPTAKSAKEPVGAASGNNGAKRPAPATRKPQPSTGSNVFDDE